ncbi:hypothetical protein Anas_06349 [Armadillidium nasatum]|uniref:C2H2-type domain-containing protein n=1 Tax=Armadillidium nasatum TaxID=96803 RepID=A0A5N5SXD8_9CRUS|nr:hypothetical protein Anas_06349 [Armadillidium nasatum]
MKIFATRSTCSLVKACKECKANYSQRSNLINHLASEHHLDVEGAPIKEQLSCTLCSFVTWAPHKLKNHKVCIKPI